MFLGRLLVLLAFVAGAVACAPPDSSAPSTAAASSAGASRVGIPALPRELERDVGPAYPDATLQAYVDRVGQSLIARSGVPGSYRFVVLDQPLANAHAAGGYVMVTRGLLALLDDEAELAAALGHEVGHVVERHAAQRARARQGVVNAAVEAATSTGSITVGRSVARDGLLALRRYSRDQELEADRYGVGLLVKAGYRGTAMASLIEKLRRQGQLELQLVGAAPDGADRRSANSTHPAPIERQEALRAVPGADSPGESNRTVYLKAIDTMSVDDPPQEGFVRGTAFLHPVLRLAFEAPRDMRLFNETDGVLGVGRDGALLYFSCAASPIEGSLADWMRARLKPTPVDIQSTEIGGADAAIGARPRGSDVGLSQGRYVLIRHGERVCYFNLLADGPNRDARIEQLLAAARSFRTLSPAEAAALRPLRLNVTTPAGTTANDLARRLPYPDLRLERLLVMNGVDSPAALMQLPQIKTVVP